MTPLKAITTPNLNSYTFWKKKKQTANTCLDEIYATILEYVFHMQWI